MITTLPIHTQIIGHSPNTANPMSAATGRRRKSNVITTVASAAWKERARARWVSAPNAPSNINQANCSKFGVFQTKIAAAKA